MTTRTSIGTDEKHDDYDSVSTTDSARPDSHVEISQAVSKLNIDQNPDEIDSFDSDRSVQNHNYHEEITYMQPFNDPGLVAEERKNVNETWLHEFVSPKSAPQSPYSAFSQAMKKLVSEKAACRFGCRGAHCKYENPHNWRPEEMAIDGIYSHWITDRILACSRPTNHHKDLKKLFYDAGIRAIFNLESPDEHIFCGHGNHASGYSYDPAEFMQEGIFIYNYAMEDYGTVKVETILDIMKVMSFAMKQGKIAVHCHAGLGRTGFIICSYLVYEYRVTAHHSIHYIRAKRPGSVQMTKQIEAVEEYEQFLIPKRRVFIDCSDVNDELRLDEHLKNQQAFIHGRDALIYKYIPRVMFLCIARLIELCTGYLIDTILLTINRRTKIKPVFVRDNLQKLTDEEKATWIDFVPSFFYEDEPRFHSDFSPYKQIIKCILMSIRDDFLTSEQQMRVLSWKQKVNKNNNGIDEIFTETDPCVISALLWTWLRLLKSPIIKKENFELFTTEDVQQPLIILSKLHKCECGIIELFAKMFAFIRKFGIGDEGRLLVYCIVHFLTHCPLPDTDELKALTSDYSKLRLHLISKQANYRDKKQLTTTEYIASNTSLDQDFLDRFETFFISLAYQFDQH